MKHRFLKLRHKILVYILPISIIAMIVSSIVAVNIAKFIMEKDFEKQKDEIAANVTNSIELMDSAYLILERNLEEDMGDAILKFRESFAQAGNDPDAISLETLKSEFDDDFDLMIIDSDTTIIKTTTQAALNFNFMEFDKKVGERINEIRAADGISHERIRTNVGTGYLSKFSYIASSNHKYILEIAYSINGLEAPLEVLDPVIRAKEMVRINPILSNIRIFDVFGYEFVDDGANCAPTEESLSFVAKAKEKGSFEQSDGAIDKRYIFINLNEDGHSMTDSSKIVEISYDRSSLTETLNRLTVISYAASIIIALAISVLIFRLSKKITHPITILSSVAKQVSLGDYDITAVKTSLDEIGELTDVFNTMVSEIRSNFTKIEKQKAELEDYNRNLEDMVSIRTLELHEALEASKKTQLLLKESNDQLENLFNNMQEGFSIQEIICDEQGDPIDYRHIKSNRAYISFSGFSNPVGRTIKELRPDTSKEWIDLCGRVALTGEPYCCERKFDNDRYYNINIFSHTKGIFALLASDITAHVKSREAIKREKNILERILDDTLSGYWDWNIAQNTQYLSPSLKTMLGYEDDELPYSPDTLIKLIVREDLPGLQECLLKHFESKGKLPYYGEVRYHHKDGSIVWVICSGHVIEWDAENRPLQMVGSHINITGMKNLEKSLHEETELLKATLLSIGDGVISTDKEGRIEIMNNIAEQMTGWQQEEAAGKPFEEIFHIKNEFDGRYLDNPIKKVLEEGEIFELADHTILISRDGNERPIEDSAAPIKDEEDNINGAVLIFRDFTEKKEKQDKIEYLSYHDQLTGLYNRRYWEEAIERTDRKENYPLALILVDVNGLKMINDAFGHAIGDRVLQKAAEIMTLICRAEDIPARIGGDEFVIMMPNTDTAKVEELLKQMGQLFEQQSVGSAYISVSYGWGIKRLEDEKMNDIFKVAEDHMYRRKLSESKSMRYKTIEVILRTLHEKSEREKKHSESVSELCEKTGIAMGMDKEDVRELKTAGLMHDIGKIAIDLSILDKPGKLTPTERIEIERHPEQGYQILRSISEFAKIAEYVLAHHERWDGTGYPGKLRAEEIPLEARIIAIADSYHAMISDRPYRKAMSKAEAVREIMRFSGIQFDPVIARLFVEQVVNENMSD